MRRFQRDFPWGVPDAQSASTAGQSGRMAPDRDAEWWPLINNGAEIDVEAALVAEAVGYE